MKPSTKPNGAPPSSAKPPTYETPALKRKAGKSPTGANTGDGTPYAESLLERCDSIPRLQAFRYAVGAAGLADLFRGDGPLTVFAPTDRAFDKIPLDQRTALLADSARLADLIRHHVVNGRVKAPREDNLKMSRRSSATN